MWQHLIEGPSWVYFVLGAVAIIFVFAFFVTKRVIYLGAIPVLAALALGFYLLDYFVESDRERAVRLSKEMIAAVERKDLEGFARYISPNFRTDAETKESILNRARPVLPYIRSITARTFQVDTMTMGRIVTVSFMVDATGTADGYPLDNQPFNLRLEFQRDDDGEWRVRRFEVWQAIGNRRYYPP
jgi:hypothetical protein